MAVYTRVPFEDIKSFVASYAIGGLVEAREIMEGVENSNYLLRTTEGPYILTLYEKRVKREDLPFFIEMMQVAAKNGLPCPAPIADKDGHTLRDLQGKAATIVSFLEGDKVMNPSPAHCFEAGKLLAQLHETTKSMQRSRVNALNPDGWAKMVPTLGRADDVAAGLHQLIVTQFNELKAAWPAEGKLPRGVIHADFFPDNVFFKGPKTSGVIDFYFACNDFYAYDIAITMNSWCFESQKTFVPERAKELLRGYESVRPLQADERAAMPLFLRGAALRFLLTRTFDWINHPADAFVKPHDPLEYRNKLEFFRDTDVMQ
jgi:homoserine kinase type II